MFVWKNFRNVFSGRDKLRRTLRNFLHTNYISIYSLLAGINPLAWDRTNHRLRSWANGVSQKNNDCRQAYFSFPSPSPVTSPFSLTPTPWDAFLSLSKPLPSLNPRWRSLDQTRSLARQNTHALQAMRQQLSGSTDYFDNVMTKFIVNNRIYAWKTDVHLFLR